MERAKRNRMVAVLFYFSLTIGLIVFIPFFNFIVSFLFTKVCELGKIDSFEDSLEDPLEFQNFKKP